VIESVRFEGRVLIVDSGSRIELEFPIVDAFARDDLVVVLLPMTQIPEATATSRI
jgi:hypothetical protein